MNNASRTAAAVDRFDVPGAGGQRCLSGRLSALSRPRGSREYRGRLGTVRISLAYIPLGNVSSQLRHAELVSASMDRAADTSAAPWTLSRRPAKLNKFSVTERDTYAKGINAKRFRCEPCVNFGADQTAAMVRDRRQNNLYLLKNQPFFAATPSPRPGSGTASRADGYLFAPVRRSLLSRAVGVREYRVRLGIVRISFRCDLSVNFGADQTAAMVRDRRQNSL